MNKTPRRRRIFKCPRLLMFDRSDTRRFSENMERLADLVHQLGMYVEQLPKKRTKKQLAELGRLLVTPAGPPSAEEPSRGNSTQE